MKSCPTCDRTFEDTFTFCLIDGSVLSAPFDPQATLTIPEPRQTEPPPTEVVQLAPEIQPTVASPQIGRTLKKLDSTIGAPPPEVMPSHPSPSFAQPIRKSNRSPLIMVVVGVLLLIGLIIYITYKRSGSTTENVNTSIANAAIANSNTSVHSDDVVTTGNVNSSSTSQANNNLGRNSKSISNANDIRIISTQPDTANSGSNSRTGENTNTSVDYSRTFSAREVTQKARIISKPEPSYTEEARQNQISGTIVLQAVFSSSGEVTNIRAVTGLPYGLTERAIAAARQIRFSPAMKDGRPVSQSIQIEYNFNLY